MICLEPCFRGDWGTDRLVEVVREYRKGDHVDEALQHLEDWVDVLYEHDCGHWRSHFYIGCGLCPVRGFVDNMEAQGAFRPLTVVEEARALYHFQRMCPALLDNPTRREMSLYSGDTMGMREYQAFENEVRKSIAKDRYKASLKANQEE